MKCDVCSKSASVFLTQIINGQMTTVNLCDTCSKEKGVTDTMGFGLAEAFVGPGSSATTRTIANELICPACGFTQSQLKKIGRMGCPECYATFREGLDNLLTAMHKGTRHIGKRPSSIPEPEPPQKRSTTEHKRSAADLKRSVEELKHNIEGLKQQIQAAVVEERYEDAARYKSEIEALTKRMTERAAE
jgi:protein arginine kinase activator